MVVALVAVVAKEVVDGELVDAYWVFAEPRTSYVVGDAEDVASACGARF